MQLVFGEIYDVDTKMLKKLDELEEHPAFYERFQEDILWATEAKAKSATNFDEVINPPKIRYPQRTFIKLLRLICYQIYSQVGILTRVWIYFLPKFKASLLEGPMYSSYSNEGNHGLKYCEKYVRDASYDHRKEVQS